MEFSPETIQARYDSLSPEIKQVIDSADVGTKVSDIAKNLNMHVDQMGVLDEEIIFVMLGLVKTTDFLNRIKSKLGLNDEQASKLTSEINEKVFLPIKSSLVGSPHAEEMKSRDEILDEIENPSPVEHPISLAKQVPAFPMAKEIVSEQVPQKSQTAIAHEFIAEKLTNTVATSTEKAAISPEKQPEKPKGYVADPYREPAI